MFNLKVLNWTIRKMEHAANWSIMLSSVFNPWFVTGVSVVYFLSRLEMDAKTKP